MNEMMITGWFYMPTTATTNEEAMRDFRHRCLEIGLNFDNAENIIVRDSDGDDLTMMQKVEDLDY